MTHGGNVRIMTVMGDARMDGLSDAGSTPARSTKKNIPGFLVVRVPGYFFVPKYAREAASGRFSVLEYNE